MLRMMGLTSLLLEKVALNEAAREELTNAALERIYGSQDVLFRDLFGFSGRGARASQLKTANFLNAWNKAKEELIDDAKARGNGDGELKKLEKWLSDNHLVVWMPMFSIWKQLNHPIKNITITYHPIVQDTISTGQSVNLTNGKKEFVEKVNKRYADANPTWVIMPAENYESGYSKEDKKNASGRQRLDDITPVGSSETPSRYKQCETYNDSWIVQTYLFQYRLTSDWDPGLFGGDTEVTILRASADGGVRTNDQGQFLPGGATYVIWEDLTIPYDDIKRMRIGDIWYNNPRDMTLDDNWKTVEAEQKILILDDDTGSFSFSGEVSAGWSGTAPSASAKISIGYDANRSFHSGDIKYYNTMDRCAYFATANQSTGHGVTQPESIRTVNFIIPIPHGGSVSYPIPVLFGTRSPGWTIRHTDGFSYYFPMKFIR